MLIDVYENNDGLVILGNSNDNSIFQAIDDSGASKFSLVIINLEDPSSEYLTEYLKKIEQYCLDGAIVYIFGCNSCRNKRPLHKLVIKAEEASSWTFNNMIFGSSFGEVACFYLEGADEFSRLTGKKRKLFGKKWINPAKLLDSIHEKYGMDRLVEMLIKAHTKEGQWVFNPNSKRGSIALLAKKFGRKFVCIEEDCEDFVFAIEKIENS